MTFVSSIVLHSKVQKFKNSKSRLFGNFTVRNLNPHPASPVFCSIFISISRDKRVGLSGSFKYLQWPVRYFLDVYNFKFLEFFKSTSFRIFQIRNFCNCPNYKINHCLEYFHFGKTKFS